jgi:hypothetical protein
MYKPLSTVYFSTESSLIKDATTAPSGNMRADEIAIETAKTDRMTAVIALMSIFEKKDAICGMLNLRMRSFLAMPISWRKICVDRDTFLRKQERDGY